jgi:ATP-binding cassette subfamily B (MDR/TAP) protein 1
LERVREGTGDKVALALQYTAQFFGGFAVAFTYDWYLTLIMMSLAPFMMICGVFIARLMAKSVAAEAEKYAEASSIAEEALASIRTVYAFNGQEVECKRYESALAKARWDGIKRSAFVGLGLAATFFVLFSSYCLAFWVGTDFVVDGRMHANVMITVFFSVMMGSMALGQAGPQFAVIGTGSQECLIPTSKWNF